MTIPVLSVLVVLAAGAAGSGTGLPYPELLPVGLLAQAPTPGPVPLPQLPDDEPPPATPPPGTQPLPQSARGEERCEGLNGTSRILCQRESAVDAARQAERESTDSFSDLVSARRQTAEAEYQLALARCEAAVNGAGDADTDGGKADCRTRAEMQRERALADLARTPDDDPQSPEGMPAEVVP